MKNIYFLSFAGGAGGDFLCSLISKDVNFYPLVSKTETVTNSCYLEDTFKKWHLDLKNGNIPKLLDSEYLVKRIDSFYTEKNLMVPTHYVGSFDQIKLPRFKAVKLFSTDLVPMYYLLLWIKRWCSVMYFENKQDFFKRIEVEQNERIKKNRIANGEIKKNKIMNSVFANKNHAYGFELPAARLLYRNSIDFVDRYFITFKYHATLSNINGAKSYNIDRLYLDPANNSTEFSQLFDMTQSINPDIIAEYHSQNLKLIEKTFNEPYDLFISSNWLAKLKEWVQLKCPNSYGITSDSSLPLCV
jgi:hypothetical protein